MFTQQLGERLIGTNHRTNSIAFSYVYVTPWKILKKVHVFVHGLFITGGME